MQDFILTHGSYLAIIVVLTLTGAGLPLPEEVPTVAAGVLSSAAVGRLNPALAFASCLIGALLGDCLVYGIGRFLGKNYVRSHPFFARIMQEDREKKMETWIQNHGMKVFLLARFLVGVRVPIYLAAGVMRVKFRNFFFVDAICATCVVGTFFWLSHFFGAWIGPLVHDSELAATAVVLLVAFFGGIYYFAWKRCQKQLHLDDDPDDGDSDASSREHRKSGLGGEGESPK